MRLIRFFGLIFVFFLLLPFEVPAKTIPDKILKENLEKENFGINLALLSYEQLKKWLDNFSFPKTPQKEIPTPFENSSQPEETTEQEAHN